MSSSRYLTLFVMLALCLAPLNGWDRTQAGQIIAQAAEPTPVRAPAQVNEPSGVSAVLAHPCRNTVATTTLIAKGYWDAFLSLLAFSTDGRFVIYQEGDGINSSTYNYPDILFIHDRQGDQESLITAGLNNADANGDSSIASISADGQYIAYQSIASNLVISDTNETWDIFLYDRLTAHTERISLAPDGSQANGPSYEPAISADGRFVAFSSEATNLVDSDTNGKKDIFLHDRLTGETRLISQAPDGAQANGASANPAISADGTFVAYDSWANNLVSGDTNQTRDVFVYNRLTADTMLVSVASDGSQGNGESSRAHLSANGRLVAFLSDANNLVSDDLNEGQDGFLHDRLSGETSRVTVFPDNPWDQPVSEDLNISADGHFVIFSSQIYGILDIFVRDLQSGITSPVSITSNGGPSGGSSNEPNISADGRYVAFSSNARLTGDGSYDWRHRYIFVYDRGPQRQMVEAWFSADPVAGHSPLNVAFANKTYGDYSASLWDFGDGITSTLPSPTHTYTSPGAYTVTLTVSGPGGTDSLICPGMIATYDHLGQISRVSRASDGTQANGGSKFASLSADGRFVAFGSYANNLLPGDTDRNSGIFVHDRQDGETTSVPLAPDWSQGACYPEYSSVSADGRFVAFPSCSDVWTVGGKVNYFIRTWYLFAHDRQSRETTRLSTSWDGLYEESFEYEFSRTPAISAGGRFVAFESNVSNLVKGDTNDSVDVFVYDRRRGETLRTSVASDGTQANNWSTTPAFSADGRFVAFGSLASNLVSSDTNGVQDIFVHDLPGGETRRISVATDGTQANDNSYAPAISLDGRFVAFESTASNLVDGDTNGTSDIFVHDLQSGETRRISLASDGSQADGASTKASLSADGRFIAFQSDASNLVAEDTNELTDIYVHDCQSGQTRRVSLASDGSQGNSASDWPSISADGQVVSFQSTSTNLVSDDTNDQPDIFVSDWGTSGPSTVQAGFSATPLTGVDSLTVTFTNQTTCGRDVACNVSTYLWLFGDGDASVLPSPTHTYSVAGVYNVTLFAIGPNSTDSLTRTAYVVVRWSRSHYLPLVMR